MVRTTDDIMHLQGGLGSLDGMDICLFLGSEEIRFRWGHEWELGSAAYWVTHARREATESSLRLGGSLAEEVAACVIGGYGIPADVALSAFKALQRSGLILQPVPPSEDDILDVLSKPLSVPGRAGPVSYRFAKQRASRLARALRVLRGREEPTNPLLLRGWLLQLPGVGPKTASWIARNVTGADGLAVVDIHVRRAGVAAGFFRKQWRLPRDYWLHETAFQAVCLLGRVSTTSLDLAIWSQLRRMGDAGGLLLGGGSEWRNAFS